MLDLLEKLKFNRRRRRRGRVRCLRNRRRRLLHRQKLLALKPLGWEY